MDASPFLPSASVPLSQKQVSPSKHNPGESLAAITPLEVLNSDAAKGIYSRLDENDIRFVVLQGGETTDPVRCKLIIGHLDALPEYEALSYVWGSQENPATIQLNGKSFFITKNLHKALIRVRRPAEDRLIWIDALAINQSDVPERNTQVRKMLVVYRSARAVLAWIGQDDEDLGGPTEAWSSAGESQGFKIPDWGSIFDEANDRNYTPLLFSFKWLNQYEFWSRAWIIQEITHSNTVFILGPYEASHRHLCRIWFQLMVHECALYDVKSGENPEDSAMAIGNRLSTTMFASTTAAGTNGMLDFDFWLSSFILKHKPQCLDPRDMIYAFYSMFPREIQDKISIDYTMPIAKLFALMTKIYIETTGNLWLLNLAEISSRSCHALPTLDPELPSWAFNFAGQISPFSRWHQPLCDKGVKNWKANKFQSRFETGDRFLLHVKGVCIGQVQQVDRSSRHKFFPGTSLDLSKGYLGVTSREEAALCLAFLGSFAEPEDFDILLVRNMDSLNMMERKYWSKYIAAQNSHFERLMFSYIPKYNPGKLEKRCQFAVGHPGVLPGDKLCLIHGCPLPLLLRKAGDSYTVIGSAYAQGYMEGEAMNVLDIDRGDMEDFCLC